MPLNYRLLESGTVLLLESGSSALAESSAATVAAAADADAGSSAADPALFPDVVYPLPLEESADGDSGPAEDFPGPATGLACTTKLQLHPRTTWAGDGEVSLTVVRFAFPAAPGVAKGDRLLWQGRHARAIAPACLQAGVGSLWVVDAEIRD